MLPLPSLNVKIDADHSCNWKCCWGCKDVVKEKSPKSTEEVTEETTTKVTHVWHHRNPYEGNKKRSD